MVKIQTAEKKTKAQTRNQARAFRSEEVRNTPLTFHGIDTEGMGEGRNHRPVLLSCGTKYVAKEDGLLWHEVFDFLYANFQPGGHAYVGFYLSYDFTQWLRSLPLGRARMLLTKEGKDKRTCKTKDGQTIVYPVGCGRWEFDLLGMKRLKIRPKAHAPNVECSYPHTGTGKGVHRWMYICDVGPFFQSSFLAAIDPKKWLEPIVTLEEYLKVQVGKERRDVAVLDDEMIEYQQAEIKILERLVTAYETGLRTMGIKLSPRQWFGPGQVAQKLLDTWCAPTAKELPEFVPEYFLEASRASYFGGWFEIMVHGLVKVVYGYDINSAYPYIIANLPCLRHGKYSEGIGNPEVSERELCLVRASVRSYPEEGGYGYEYNRQSFPIGAMLHRDRKGLICRPIETHGWYWLHEVEAAKRAGCVVECVIHEWVKYDPCDCPPPLKDIAALYEMRIEVGKDSVHGRALRLGYNSAYGKTAQSVGEPKFANPIYASLITAGCRTMILDAIATHPKGARNVVMVATDGVYFLDPHPALPISSKLGEWSKKVHDNMCLFKPGVYWDDKDRAAVKSGNRPSLKSRGVNAKDLGKHIEALDDMFRAWPVPKNTRNDMMNRPEFYRAKNSVWPTVEFTTSFSITSIVQAVQPGWEWEKAGEVLKDRKLNQNAREGHSNKRDGLWYDPEYGIYRSQAKDVSHWLMPVMVPTSYPYQKRFGMDDPWSDEREQSFGITPDGYVTDTFRRGIMGE